MRFPAFISLLVFLGALAWWFWPSTENATSTSTQTPIATAEEVALPVADSQEPVTGNKEPIPEEAGHAGPKPSPAEAGANSVAGIRLLDSWHRASTFDRSGVADSARGAEGKALQNFTSLWNDGSDAYRVVLKNQIPAQLGAEFASYAEAWTKKGLKGLVLQHSI